MLCRIAAITAAALLVTATASANLLLQPSFEVSEGAPSAVGPDVSTSTSAWSGWNNWTPPYSAFITDVVARTGTQSGKTYSGPNAGIYQYVPAVAGQTYEGSAYFLNMTGDAWTGATTIDVRLTFRDAADANIGGALISPQLNATLANDVWTMTSVQAVAPAGTASVQFMMFMNNSGGGGAMYADDASLVVVPEPTALGAIGLCALGMLRRRSA